jgi:ankyrin repeat protein
VNRNIPTRRMREHPDLEQLKRQAKELLRGFAAGEAESTEEVNAHYHAADKSDFALHHAQLVIARSYGFESWAKLKAYVDGVTIQRLAEAVKAGDLPKAGAMLGARPELAGMAMSYGDERRPIHFAVMERRPEMVALLMRQGASARQGVYPHRDATSAWTIAKERGYGEIVAVIEAEELRASRKTAPDAEPDADHKPENTPVLTARDAVAAGDEKWLRAQHAAGTLVNTIRWDEGGLLTIAVRHNRPEILSLLLDFGFDPNEPVSSSEGDWTAYSQGYPLWHCAALGRLEMAETLLRRGADPNVHVDSSGSAVYSAFSHQQWAMVDLLRLHGGVVTADTAAIYRQTDLARQMLENGTAAAEELLRFGASGGDPEIVRMSLQRIDWPRDDPRWFGPLTEPHYFWHHIPWLYAGNRAFDRSTYLACFRLILERCDPNLTGSLGRTALHEVAAMRAHVTEDEAAAFARALLDAGAAVNVRDDILKSTPLGWACRWGRVAVAKLLLDYGADPWEPDADPWATPRAWAEKMGHGDLTELLTNHS